MARSVNCLPMETIIMYEEIMSFVYTGMFYFGFLVVLPVVAIVVAERREKRRNRGI